MASTSQVTLKLLVDIKKQRVLFAEAGKDFVDFLFSLLALPIATVISLLDNRAIVGGLSNLYKSVSDLNDDYIQSNQNKDALLKPKVTLPYHSPLLDNREIVGGLFNLYKSVSDLNDDCIQSNQNKDDLLKPKFTLPYQSPQIPVFSTKAFSSSPSPPLHSSAVLYKCDRCDGSLLSTCNRSCPSCGRTMTTISDRYVLKSAADAKGGGFVKGLVTYMVTDDLVVSPMSTISNITLLNEFNIKDLGALEEKVVHIGMNEGLELLKHSLNSKTVLTDVFLREKVAKDENSEKV